METLANIRKANLRTLIAQWNGATSLAKKLRYAHASYLSQMVHGKRPITEKTARKIEAVLKLPALWLDTERGEQSSAPIELDANALARVLDAVNTVKAGLPIDKKISQTKYSEIIAFVYKGLSGSGRLPDNDAIGALLRLAATD